jgi:5'-nucleotidase
MRVLVTNDDGVGSPGLRTLATAAVASGLDVLVAAPLSERSGSSASLAGLESDGRLVIHRSSIDGLTGVPCLGVEATPAFIVLAAFVGAFGPPPPELVLSGINHGPNTGHAVLHSGTVGAALSATTHGCPAVAISLASPHPTHWETSAAVIRRILTWLGDHRLPDIALNVNVPDVPRDQLRGIRHASLAGFGAVQAHVAEIGEGYVTMTFAEVEADYKPGSDAGLVYAGWATVTALVAPCEAVGCSLDGLVDSAGTSPAAD